MGSKSYSKGITWIDDCRIPFANLADQNYATTNPFTTNKMEHQNENWGTKKIGNVSKETGRFPANLLVCDDMLNDGSVSKGGRMVNLTNPYDFYEGTNKTYTIQRGEQIDDKGTNSRYYDIDKWFKNILESCG